MNKDELSREIARLRAEIERHNLLYYSFANPEISDYDYDQMAKRLQDLEAKLPEGKTVASPLNAIGNDLAQGAKTIPHKVRMTSLDNAYSLEELNSFIAKTQIELAQKTIWCAELKIDGFGINLFYDKGNLQYATTRGNGVEGEDVTANFSVLAEIPHSIAYLLPIEIRGEIYIPLKDFLAMNEMRREQEQKPFANPRNAAAGSIKLKNPEEVKSRNLKAIFYALGYYESPLESGGKLVTGQFEVLDFLHQLGFPTSKHLLCNSFAEVEGFCNQMETMRYQLPFDIDGIVVKLNELELQKRLGYTGKSPKWAIAYKFKPEMKDTVLEEVSFQVGRTGAVTPVANLKPVLISGSTVSRATLHNADEIIRLGLHLGDTVRIVKSGEIIPKIMEVDLSKRPPAAKPVKFISSCPVCANPLERDEDGSINYCPNASCPAQVQRRIEHFASREAMDISGLGISLIARLLSEDMITGIPDIYQLDYERIANLDRLGSRSAENLKQAIEQSKTKNFDKVLFALGIRHIGAITARSLASYFGTIDDIAKAEMEDLQNVPDVGGIIAQSLHSFFINPSNLALIAALKAAGLCFAYRNDLSSNVLEGKTFLITGTLPGYGRKEIEALITSHGGKILGSVSKQLQYLVTGENAGSKLDKANKLGTVKIINEAELLTMINA